MGTQATSGARFGSTGDPGKTNTFEFEIEGISIGEFSEVELPEIESEVIEYHIGNNNTTLKRPGRTKYGDVTVKRIWTYADAQASLLYQWHQSVISGNADQKSMTCYAKDEQDNIMSTINFFQAWPKKYKLENFNAGESKYQQETVTFAIESYTIS